MLNNLCKLAPAGLVFAAHGAAALELDTLLPLGVPGFGTAPGVTIITRQQPDYDSMGINLGNVTLNPQISGGFGYDSMPNGLATGAPVLNIAPSVLAEDRLLGLGAYAAANVSNYPTQSSQNTTGYTLAIGERAILPQQEIILGVVNLRAHETGFALNTLLLAIPLPFTVTALRGSDKIGFGMFFLTPEFSISRESFPSLPEDNRTDYRQGVTLDYLPGGPAKLVLLLHATESEFHNQPEFNANTYEALAGFEDDASGLWTIRLLGGAASRKPDFGQTITAPVLEAALSWVPDELDDVNFSLARELDDPDQESADGYTLSRLNLSLDHEYLRNVILSGSLQISHAAYFNTALTETICNTSASVKWRLNRALALSAIYQFNDRQANEREAANEHIVTLNIIWTP